MAKLKEDEWNKKKTALVKHCSKHGYRIDFVNFKIFNFNIDFAKRINNIKNLMINIGMFFLKYTIIKILW